MRIAPDGSAPKDNPFVANKEARPEIWTLGHRNILGAALDDKKRLWIAEMGPKGGDELNLIERGKDYGWPTIGYGEEYSGERIHEKTQEPGLEQPVDLPRLHPQIQVMPGIQAGAKVFPR